MSKLQTRSLLSCYECANEFKRDIDPRVTGDAASLPAALLAHKAGWLVKDGRIYCPDCAKSRRTYLSL